MRLDSATRHRYLVKRDDQDDTGLAARNPAAAQKVLNKVPLNKVSLSYVGAVLLPSHPLPLL